MTSTIKPSQLTRVGYTYQDYICVQLLIDWFHDPEKYQWVCIEGANTEQGELKTIDDVIAFDKNGRYSLIQVKFTTDSAREDLKLDFDWLLKKKGAGTSLIQKWARDVGVYRAKGKISIATLKTNRAPDDELAKCLNGKKIEIDRISQQRLAEVISQVGSYDTAKEFFDEFVFDHSQSQLEDLYQHLYNQIVPRHATPEGWYRFLEAVQQWATRRNEPSPDGQITLNHIYELLGSGIGRSLSQFFEVPEGYAPPTEQFHAEMLQRIASNGGWVVSGLPGMGKSTYLSHLTSCLVGLKIPVIRHHYSLSTQSIVDRTTYPNVARSLQHQLQTIYPELFVSREFDANKLEEWLALAADRSATEDKILVVIIDGLDHVAREQREITQLEHLVNRLLPFKDKFCLVFGTQPVSDAHLPAKLSVDVPKADRWLNLPAMDMNSIKCWVENLSDSKRIAITIHGEHKSEALAEVSEALLRASGGYPLHIFYSLQNLALLGKSVNKYEIEKLPVCPDGDIRIYYAALWSSLPESSRAILLLIACVDFPWPDKDSIGSRFENSLEFLEAYSTIQHLVEKRRSGIFPFHGSLLIFLREQQAFKDSSHTLLIRVKDWLLTRAPTYWKWGWQWIVEAHMGDSQPILNGITREWLVDSFCRGYPPQHIEHIISSAEKIALELELYAQLVHLRLLKIRLVNGPEFQVQEYPQFMRCALSWSLEKYGLHWGADNLNLLGEKEIAVVGALFRDIDDEVRLDCFKEIMRRLEFYVNVGDDSGNQKIPTLIDGVIDLLCDANAPSVDMLLEFLDRVTDKETYFRKAFDKLIATGNGYIILQIEPGALPGEIVQLFWTYFVIVCGLEKISILDRPEHKEAGRTAFGSVALWLCNHSVNVDELMLPQVEDSERSTDVYVLCEIFFAFLAKYLQNGNVTSLPSGSFVGGVQGFLEKASEILEYAASKFAEDLRAGRQIDPFSIHEIVMQTALPRTLGRDYHLAGAEFSLEQALTRISAYVYVLLGESRVKSIAIAYKEIATENPWWNAENWLGFAATIIPRAIPNELSDGVLQSRIDELRKKRDSTSMLANDSLDVAKLALSLRRESLGRDCLFLSAQHVLGYGWRKDTTFSELFDAIQYCSDYGVGNIPEWLRRVAPFVNDVFDFSEREIRHIPGWNLRLIAQYAPERLVDEFDYHLQNQNWGILPDVLENFVAHCDLTCEADFALIRCLSLSECISALEKRAETDPRFVPLLDEKLKFLGGRPPEKRESYSTPVAEKVIDIELSKYPPEDLNALYRELKEERDVFDAGEFLRLWIGHWEGEGRGLQIISEFDKFWDSHREFPYSMRKVIGEIFSLSQKLQGARAAYRWAVRDIRTNNHWSRWSGSRSMEVLKKYAQVYSSEWKRLLTDTTIGESIQQRGNEWIVVPSSQMVSYLLAAGQSDLACQVTEVMLESLEGEISHLPLSPLHWYPTAIPREQISARLLLLYYKFPDRFIRRQTAIQILDVLERDESFRHLYLERLADLRYETDVSDFIFILTLSKQKLFEIDELTKAIKFPSLLSDEALEILGGKIESAAAAGYFTTLTMHDYEFSSRFEKSKDGIAPIFYSPIDKLGQKLRYPLASHFSAEWDRISARQTFLFFNTYNFASGNFSPQDCISCSLSTEAETVLTSAYLRTISFASGKLGVPREIVPYYTDSLRPFCGLLSKVMPASKPVKWPALGSIGKDEALPSEADLEKYIRAILASDEIVLCANGPILREISGVSCDLSITTIFLENDYIGSAKDLYFCLTGQDDSLDLEIVELAKEFYPDDAGRFDTDLLLRGLFQPQFLFYEGKSEIQVEDSELRYMAGGICNAVWRYWTDSWYPVWYRGLGPALGTYLETSGQIFNLLKSLMPGSYYLLARLTIVDKRGYSADENKSEIYAICEA